MYQHVQPNCLSSLLKIQTNLLVFSVQDILFCSSKISLACVDVSSELSLIYSDCMKKNVLNGIKLIKVKCWASYPLGHLRVEYLFLAIDWLFLPL